MPSCNTFSIEPIKDLIRKYQKSLCIDPFANSNKIADVTNDIDTQYDTDFHLDAIDFLKLFGDRSIGTVLFDPPYSPRQVSEVYKQVEAVVNMQTTQSSFWSKLKQQIARVTEHNGIVITCGWNSGGVGEGYGFEIQEILLVAHGGWHNDTIVTVERKIVDQQTMDFT